MTMLATVVRSDFVLSVADRCGSMTSGNQVKVVDTKLNKHVTFALKDFTGSLTYTGFSQWPGADGKSVIADRLIADTIADCAAKEWNLGSTMARLAFVLNEQSDWLARLCKTTGPFFTIHLAGFTKLFSEPMIGLITDSDPVPSWNEDDTQYELDTIGRFRMHIAIRARPCVLWGGDTRFLSNAERETMDAIVAIPSVAPYDIAKFAVSCIRESSKRTKSIGSRISAIIAPRIGTLDTGFWQDANDQDRAAMPRMVFHNGQQWDSSEMGFDLASFIPGTLDRHNISYRSLIHGRVPKRILRRLNRMKCHHKTPTLYEVMMFTFFGKHWDDPANDLVKNEP